DKISRPSLMTATLVSSQLVSIANINDSLTRSPPFAKAYSPHRPADLNNNSLSLTPTQTPHFDTILSPLGVGFAPLERHCLHLLKPFSIKYFLNGAREIADACTRAGLRVRRTTLAQQRNLESCHRRT